MCGIVCSGLVFGYGGIMKTVSIALVALVTFYVYLLISPVFAVVSAVLVSIQ